MKYKINLLGKRLNKGGLVKQINYFSYNYLRYILVITQLIVISVLFFRFTIDQDIIDLKDTIYQQEEILKSVKPIIDESEIIDFKIKTIKTHFTDQEKFKNQISYITSIFPSSIFLTKLSISDKSVSMEGSALDANQLQAFYKRLKIEKKYSEINLGTITKDEKGYLFNLTLNNYIN